MSIVSAESTCEDVCLEIEIEIVSESVSCRLLITSTLFGDG